jgi:glutaminyl-peptide cyclotransferase
MSARSRLFLFVAGSASVVFMGSTGCHNPSGNNNITTTDTTHAKTVSAPTIPDFNADSCYNFIKTQVAFGPRTPGSKAHEECLQYFLNELKKDSLTVTEQKSSARTFDGKRFEFDNITASFAPLNPNRIVIFGHWDTRPFADADSVEPMKPFDGADDGGSSAAMLLEIARHLHKVQPNIGVDLVFIDLEDYGQQDDRDGDYPDMKDSWALGSQYWAKNLPQGYSPRFGILLDMVGGKNAVFPMEGTSMVNAPDIVNKVWDIAGNLGYSNYFTHETSGMTTDDHTYINQIAAIPTIDIVDYRIVHSSDGKTRSGDYPYFHHKHSDNMSVIDPNTLKMVGNVVMNVIYTEKAPPKA